MPSAIAVYAGGCHVRRAVPRTSRHSRIVRRAARAASTCWVRRHHGCVGIATVIPFQLHRRIPLLRRPFYQRDRARAESDRLVAEIRLGWLRHRPDGRVAGAPGVTGAQAADDLSLVERVIAAYRASSGTPLGDANSFWLQTISDIKRPLHDLLMTGSLQSVAQMLRSPAENMLFCGFDSLNAQDARPQDPGWQRWMQSWTGDNLLRLAEAVGAWRLEYPEAASRGAVDPEEVLRALDSKFGFAVRFPNPFADEVGLATSRGIVSYRAVQALYQAYRIFELIGRRSSARIAEIGGGLGRTAYYARQFGIRNYTIIDLPMTAVAQGYFLGRTLGADAVGLFGESSAGCDVLPPMSFLEGTEKYDLVVNVDSLTEMARDTARAYVEAIRARAAMFLSINHEYNAFSVNDILAESGLHPAARTPYWLRRGYVDEVFEQSA
jgi:hypothetical protein